MLALAILVTIFIGISAVFKFIYQITNLLNLGGRYCDYDQYEQLENGMSVSVIIISLTLSIAWRAFAIVATWILYRGI